MRAHILTYTHIYTLFCTLIFILVPVKFDGLALPIYWHIFLYVNSA